MRSIISTTLVVILGSFMLWVGTDEFRAFTAEGARRVAIADNPRPIPEYLFEDALGEIFKFQDFNGKLVLATFIYTRCGDLCPAVEMNLQQIYNSMPSEALGKEVQFLSISFDPRDDAHALHHYGHHYQADHVTWRFGSLLDDAQLEEMLSTFEVTVLPNDTGGFDHNAAILLIDRDTKIIRIFDYDDIDGVLQTVTSMLNTDDLP